MKPEFDYIVVGGGSAGAVIAARLSEDKSVSVLLLEAGGRGTSPFLYVPNGIFFRKKDPKLHWFTTTEPDETRNNRQEILNCGRGLGGGSAINGMEFIRGLRSDYEGWQQAAGSQWGPEAVNRSFAKVETALAITLPRPLHDSAKRFIDSARALGFPTASSDLSGSGAGVMPTPANAGGGVRQSTAYGYLRPARARSNLTVRPHSLVCRLIIEQGQVRGVVYRHDGQERRAYAAIETVLAAGAIGSPQILMLSGIGPADHLRATGVAPVLDLPSVGQGLQDHPAVWVSARVGIRTWNDDLKPFGLMRAGIEWLLHRSGPAGSGICHATLFGASNGAGGEPDFQAHFVPAGYVVTDSGVDFIDGSSIATAVSLCRPQGRGSVRLRGTDPLTSPSIRYRLLDGADDIRRLGRACRIIRDIYAQEPMRAIMGAEVSPGAGVRDEADWASYVQSSAMNMCHPAGTCRMGRDADSVVDERLRLRGIGGVRVADASIMPAITSGNTNAPAIMIGEHAAAMIAADR